MDAQSATRLFPVTFPKARRRNSGHKTKWQKKKTSAAKAFLLQEHVHVCFDDFNIVHAHSGLVHCVGGEGECE